MVVIKGFYSLCDNIFYKLYVYITKKSNKLLNITQRNIKAL